MAVRRAVGPRRFAFEPRARSVARAAREGRIGVSADAPPAAATVVVCEDDPATLELLCDHLPADRYAALPAPTASDALRLCHFKAPDLLLLDLRLPDVSGLDVLRQIRAADGVDRALRPAAAGDRPHAAAPARPTGCAASHEGADDYVSKPFSYVGAERAAAAPCCAAAATAARAPCASARSRSTRRAARCGWTAGRCAGQQGVRAAARARRGAAAGVHQGGAVARRLGLSLDGPDAHPRLARQPAAPQARSRARPLRPQLLGRRLPADRRVSPVPWELAGIALAPRGVDGAARRRRGSASSAVASRSTVPCTSCAVPSRRWCWPRPPACAGGPRPAPAPWSWPWRPSTTSTARSTAARRRCARARSRPAHWSPARSSAGEARPRRRAARSPSSGAAGAAIVSADPARVAQALDNLLANAVEHGGLRIRVCVSIGAAGVRVLVASDGAWRGTGRAATRAADTGSRSRAGACAAHGGRLAIEAGGSRTVVALELPLAPMPAPGPLDWAARPPLRRPAARGRRMLAASAPREQARAGRSASPRWRSSAPASAAAVGGRLPGRGGGAAGSAARRSLVARAEIEPRPAPAAADSRRLLEVRRVPARFAPPDGAGRPRGGPRPRGRGADPGRAPT